MSNVIEGECVVLRISTVTQRADGDDVGGMRGNITGVGRVRVAEDLERLSLPCFYLRWGTTKGIDEQSKNTCNKKKLTDPRTNAHESKGTYIIVDETCEPLPGGHATPLSSALEGPFIAPDVDEHGRILGDPLALHPE